MNDALAQLQMFAKEIRVAQFSVCRRYRYTLDIVWDKSKPLCQVIGLNPSTADEIQDDPTVRRCKSFARREGFGGLVMTNLFAFRATDPEVMKAWPTPIGEKATVNGAGGTRFSYDERNDNELVDVSRRCGLVIAAWGVHGVHMNRASHVSKLITGMKCLGKTNAGFPKHPLYLSAATELIPFN